MSVPFRPSYAATVSINVSSSSQAVQIQPTGTTGTWQVRIVNDGTATVWLRFGDAGVAATIPNGSTAGGFPLPAGAIEVLTVVGTHVAAIAAGSTGSIYFTPGQGI